MRTLTRTAIAAALAALALGGCASSSTPYQPLSSASQVAGGYTDRQLTEGRFQVTFAGNRLTSRETVESYLLFRAAELTLTQGYDWFVVVDKEMDHKITRETRSDPAYRPWFAPEYGEWRPYWRYYESGHGWREWDPYHGDRFWTEEVTSEEFEATAEIRMGRGAIPADENAAMEARMVQAELRPRIEYPE